MLEILRLMKEMKERIGCDIVQFALFKDQTLKISAWKGQDRLQRTYSDIEIQQIRDPQILVDSCVTYMKNAFHPPQEDQPKNG